MFLKSESHPQSFFCSWIYYVVICGILFLPNLIVSQTPDTLFFENCESGIGSWYADNGLWEAGEPTTGPTKTHSGTSCFGTVLDGNYPPNANTRLISPSITLPIPSNDETIQLKFWQWFNIENHDDQGFLQISVNSGAWEPVSTVQIDGGNPTWSQYVADLTSYAGSSVRIGFYLTSNSDGTVYSGWYVDDISIEKAVVSFPNPEDFESGVGYWSADNGLWEVGETLFGPENTHSGTKCMGTVLNGNYQPNANTRLISPSFILPTPSTEEKIQLKFWQWFNIENHDDQGFIQISVNSGAWQTISNIEIDGGNPAWSQYVADLTEHAGSSIQIGFYFTSNSDGTVYSGWYIDDVSIETEVITFPNPEDFESGVGHWSSDNGLWEVGEPSVGPSSTHSGTNCIGTVVNGNYRPNANTRLISPSFILPTLSTEEKIQLKFWQWFNIENHDDQGFIQISVNSGDWQTISNIEIDGGNPAWSQYVADLTAFAGSSVRIGFYFTSNSDGTVYSGWYVDDISIEKQVVTFPNPEDFESGVGNWSSDNGLWEVGEPTVGPSSAHSGTNCIGTVLSGNYQPNSNTRLISPEITLTPITGQNPMLFFYHWFIIENNDDNGYIQLSVNGGDWQTVSNPISGSSETWSQFGLDLAAYADSTIQIAFYFTSNSDGTIYSGWYIDDIRIEGIVTDIEDEFTKIPFNYMLNQNYPNPFNPATTISYQLKNTSNVKLTIYDINGREIETLVNQDQIAGPHSVKFDATKFASGVYIYTLKAGASFKQSRKMLLVR